MHHSTRGGSSDTEVKELTVIPIWDASSGAASPARVPLVVITATPVGKHPRAFRNARESKSISHPEPARFHTRLSRGVHDRRRLDIAAPDRKSLQGIGCHIGVAASW